MKNRIHSKKDLNTYLICDEIAFTGHKLSTIRRILLCLARHQNLGLWFLKKNRRLEYRFNNRNKSPFHKLVYFLAGYRYVRWQHQYSCSIPVNVIGPGFRIWHFAQGSGHHRNRMFHQRGMLYRSGKRACPNHRRCL